MGLGAQHTSVAVGQEAAWPNLELLEQLGHLQHALVAVIRDICEKDPGHRWVAKPADLTRMLRIDPKLASQVYRSLETGDVRSFGGVLPPFRGLERVVVAARRAGASESACRELETSISIIIEAIDTAFGERWAFDVAFATHRPDSENSTDLEPRRTAYRAAAEAHGFSAESEFVGYLVAPSDGKSERFDLAGLRGKFNIRRFRPGVVIPVHAERARTGRAVNRNPEYMPPPRPIFARTDAEATVSPLTGSRANIVSKWTKPADAPIRARRTRSGMEVLELGGEAIGTDSSCDIVTAQVAERAIPGHSGLSSDGTVTHFRLVSHVKTPVGRLHVVIGVADDRERAMEPVFSIGSMFPLDSEWTKADVNPLHIRGTRTSFTDGSVPPATARFAPTQEFVSEAIAELGWSNHRFRFWSFEVPFPLLQSAMSCRLILPAFDPTSVRGQTHQRETTHQQLEDVRTETG
ncbi:MAG: hypothetical protein AAGI30_00105 [Planctomycetota bacterium]